MTTDHWMATVRGVPDVQVLDEGGYYTSTRVGGHYWHPAEKVTDMRRVYVLDITEDEARDVADDSASYRTRRKIAQQLADQVTLSPAIEEPTLYGAVVALTG